jgi:hypothetical protein
MVKFVYTTALASALISSINAAPSPNPNPVAEPESTFANPGGWRNPQPSFPNNFGSSPQIQIQHSQPQVHVVQAPPQPIRVMSAPQVVAAPQPQIVMAAPPQPQIQMVAAPQPAPVRVMAAPQPQPIVMAAPPRVMVSSQPVVHHVQLPDVPRGNDGLLFNPFEHNNSPKISIPEVTLPPRYSNPENDAPPHNPMFNNPLSSQPESYNPFHNPAPANSQPELPHFNPPPANSQPYHPSFPSDDEHDGPNTINLNSPGIVEGQDLIYEIEYRADGNYKLEIIYKSHHPIIFNDLKVGKCNEYTPGVAIIGKNSEEVTMEVDMAICQKECDFTGDQLMSSIDVLNQPIDIIFGIEDETGHVVSRYHVRPNAMYHEDYIVELNTGTEDTRQLVIDDAGNFFQVEDNIQFSYMTYMSDEFVTKTPSSKSSAPPGWTTYLEIAPTNGFTPEKMTAVPEICFIKDLTNAKTLLLWDMGANPKCVQNLKYLTKEGAWQYPINFYHVMGYNSHQINHNSFKLTCNIRLCGNTIDNPCQQKLEMCPYSDLV